MKLKIVESRKVSLGIKAVVAVLKENGSEVYRDEVQLWRQASRRSFIEQAILAANGHLNEIERSGFRTQWDAWLRQAESDIKDRLQHEQSNALSASEAEKPVEMTAEEEAKARDYLCDPQLITRTQDDLTEMGIVGEDFNKVLIHAVATSRKMRNPLGATIESQSSAGKNNLKDKVISLMPPEDVQSFTGGSAKALNYVGEHDLEHKIVTFAETVGRVGLEYSIRSLLSEKVLEHSVAVAEYDGGPRKTRKFVVRGPVAYIDTTTENSIHPENATRVFELHLDESAEQTAAINKLQLREAGFEGIAIRQKRERIMRIHPNVQRMLKPELDVSFRLATLFGSLSLASEDGETATAL